MVALVAARGIVFEVRWAGYVERLIETYWQTGQNQESEQGATRV
jgi:hypothetical protein